MRAFVWLLMLGTLFSSKLYADDVFKWTDEAGALHFTDNKSNVPLEQANVKIIHVKAGRVSKKNDLKVGVLNGEKTWDKMCASCHYIKFQAPGAGLRQLPFNIRDSSLDPEEMAKRLKASLTLRAGDMGDIKLSDGDTKAVGEYILSRLAKE